jgi:hypothetical protein
VLIGAAVALGACGAPDPAKLQVSYGPWEPLHHGTRPPGPSAPVARTLTRGTGPAVTQGMMIEARVVTTFGQKQPGIKPSERVRDLGRRWIYVDFDADDLPRPTVETTSSASAAANLFSAGKSRFAASFIGVPLGSTVTFAPYADRTENRSIVGGLSSVPFGSIHTYDDFKMPPSDDQQPVYAISESLDNETSFEILRACTGGAAQRLVTMRDTTEISIAQDLGRTFKSTVPRSFFAREARWSGTCTDGTRVHFDYGPVMISTPVGTNTGPGVSALTGPWINAAWRKLERGVRKGP